MSEILKHYICETALLSKEINQKVKIYLDTKYWVDICNATLDKKVDNEILEVYSKLKKGVKENKIICPISLPIYLEVLSQKDSTTLNQTAKIIDELSQGYILKNDLLELELSEFFFKILDINLNQDDSENHWGYIANIFGIAIFQDDFPMQKKYFEKLKKIKLSNIIGQKKYIEKFSYNNSLININKFQDDKINYSNEHNTFEELYHSEVSGMIKEQKEIIILVYKSIIENKAISENIEIDKNYDYTSVVNLIYNLFVKKKINNSLASIDISAMLHAKLRWNKTQKYKKGDLIDIMHATSALAYYDYFFTEKSLYSMINECKYDKKYNCTIQCKNEEVIKNLKNIVL